ncbi:outer membrane efflux protein [Leptospira fainei serovar Hurstbridge str. BUT 6]|uniref:Outer membrane efflux protein n=1 Tax=Leptospira fainei serovar Hurstbridge str. BUT 6 TaxID=1193011 RepID=S3UV41_9LEPT|nr:TolC family protein [Leptospira fainei]EPG73113.1 outer membrane efflux protein [Leptospira fainei serovar Hurstbridge str. BUT 6]
MKEYWNSKRYFLFRGVSVGIIFWGFSLFPESLEESEFGKGKTWNTSRLIRYAMENSVQAKIARLDLDNSEYDWEKENGKYNFIGNVTANTQKTVNLPLPQYTLQGRNITNNTISGGLSKAFTSGTTLGVTVADNRYETDAGKRPEQQGTIAQQFAQPSLHFGSVGFTLKQDLLKNVFGYQQRRNLDMSRRSSAVRRLDAMNTLSRTVVQSILAFWNLSLAEENLRTATLLVKSVKNVKDITTSKIRLGVAEEYESGQWNALLISAENQLRQTKLERDRTRRDLLVSLGKDPETPFELETSLEERFDPSKSETQELDEAFLHRYDFRSMLLQKQNAISALEVAKNGLLPSLYVSGTYNSRTFDRNFPQDFNGVGVGRYTQNSAEIKMETPIGNDTARAEFKNAQTQSKKIDLLLEQTKDQVKTDVRQGLERIRITYDVLEESKKNLAQAEKFYTGILPRYRFGRTTSVNVKNALDLVAQARYGLMQAKVNYNTALVQYELSKGTLFQKYGMDAEEILNQTIGDLR